MIDIGLTHIVLSVTDIDRSVAFYGKYAGMQVVHRRRDETGIEVAWISDGTRPFVVVLMKAGELGARLTPLAHLGVGCASREQVDTLCAQARTEGVLLAEPRDSGPPVGYWAFLRDPDGHTLELSHGQEIGLRVGALPPRRSA
jgi:catechol 2,3-dioxygenase-like lactoylglutathione lyase family enzyme